MPKCLELDLTPEAREKLKRWLKEGGVYMSKRGRRQLRAYRAAMRAEYKGHPNGQAVWVSSAFQKADQSGHILVAPVGPSGIFDRMCTVRMESGKVFDQVLFYEKPPREIPGLYAACYPRGTKP